VRADLIAVKNYIFSKYYDPQAGYIKWQLKDGNGALARDAHLTAQLDQLVYLLPVVQDLPAAEQVRWKRDMVRIANILRSKFYNAEEKLFFTRADKASDLDLVQTGTDFGHNAKILWNFRAIGRVAARPDFIAFANANAPGLLQRAFMAFPGTWASGVTPGGAIDGNKTWWIHAELDQLASVMALRDRSGTFRLKQAYDYWLNHFVDKEHGEVWNTIAANGNIPDPGFPKSWFWKNAFHSVEHAYFAYLTSAQLENKPAVLYYAFKTVPARTSLRPGLFAANLSSLTSRQDVTFGRIYRASFTGIRF
jgi:hypothetical protein